MMKSLACVAAGSGALPIDCGGLTQISTATFELLPTMEPCMRINILAAYEFGDSAKRTMMLIYFTGQY